MPTQTYNPTQYSKKIDFLEKEIKKLKEISKYLVFSKNISLRGILKNKEISGKDIEKAKKSLFKTSFYKK